ncbi:MAG: nucleotidyl transferase AbiEii/AbiGii toxin family protein [Fimbriimonadaceae bacterium]|nr:nucleotidyl transferase AbiEii/AbiGii toxin family protein [Fimbriimonadaceae bacterium]
MLKLLFGSELGAHLVFKGGTSLSKAYGAIRRFSEELDLTLAPAYVRGDSVSPDGWSQRQTEKWAEETRRRCGAAVEGPVQALLTGLITAALPARVTPSVEFEVDQVTDSPVPWFRAPTTLAGGVGQYIAPDLKLEFGSRTDQEPTERRPVTPWIGELYAQQFASWSAEVVALDFARTFWEKATILHLEAHRAGPLPPRSARHYADLVMLLDHPRAAAAIADSATCERVVAHKRAYFRCGWANYEAARPGTFRLVPAAAHRAALASDYLRMAEMLYDPPLPFDALLGRLGQLEHQINADG